MTSTDVWPSFLVLGLAALWACLPAFRVLDTPPGLPQGRRHAGLDGLRGLAASAVFLHHAAMTPGRVAYGTWEAGSSRFHASLGPAGVGAFFMITGFLFYGILLREGGRPRWVSLAIGRAARILPLGLGATAIAIVVLLASAGWTFAVPAAQALDDLGRWLTIGIMTPGAFNGRPDAPLVLAGVTWTLRFEWCFYAALPLFALGIRAGVDWLAPATLGAAGLAWWAHGGPYILSDHDAAFAVLFSCGMAAAWAGRAGALHYITTLPQPVGSSLVLLGWTFALTLPGTYSALTLAPLALSFGLVAAGHDAFGLLTSRAFRRLGDGSYGIYLLQGPVLWLVPALAPLHSLTVNGGVGWWCVEAFCATVLVTAAAIAHAWIELPGMAIGRRLDRARSAESRAA